MSLRFFTLTLLACVSLGLSPRAFAQAGNNNPGGPTAEYYGNITTAGDYDPWTGNARREIDDIVVPGTIGAYPLKYTRTLNTRGHASPNNYTWAVSLFHPYFDPGTCGPEIEYCDSLGSVTYPSGASFELLQPSPGSPWYLGANGRHGADDLLFDCAKAGSQCIPGDRFEIWRADGGKVLFQGPPNAHTFMAYAIIDPYGQQTTLSYNGGQLWKVTEPGGRYLEFIYQNGDTYTIPGPYGYESVTPRFLGTVTANDGRGNIMESVSYSYDWVPMNDGSGVRAYRLRNVYYADGAVATYTYVTPNDYIPTGQSRAPTLIHSCNDPRYAGPMKYIDTSMCLRRRSPTSRAARSRQRRTAWARGFPARRIRRPSPVP